MPEVRVGLGFLPGWKAAKAINDYFAGWEADPPSATDEEFTATFEELVGKRPQTVTIGCQTTDEEADFSHALSAKEASPGRAPPLERAPPIGTHGPHPAASRVFAPWPPLSE